MHPWDGAGPEFSTSSPGIRQESDDSTSGARTAVPEQATSVRPARDRRPRGPGSLAELDDGLVDAHALGDETPALQDELRLGDAEGADHAAGMFVECQKLAVLDGAVDDADLVAVVHVAD